MSIVERVHPDWFAENVGIDLGQSEWIEITQENINTFADITQDWQFIHIDVERARAETPFGGTVAHGFLTLSMLSLMSEQILPEIEGLAMGMNYGFDKIRFLSPTLAGKKIRGHFVLKAVDRKAPTVLMLTVAATIEVEGSEKPTLIADWVMRAVLDEAFVEASKAT